MSFASGPISTPIIVKFKALRAVYSVKGIDIRQTTRSWSILYSLAACREMRICKEISWIAIKTALLYIFRGVLVAKCIDFPLETTQLIKEQSSIVHFQQ